MRNRFDSLLRYYHQQRGQFDLLTSRIKSNEAELASVSVTIVKEREVLRLLQLVGSAAWDTTKNIVESLVTRALNSIFYDRDYKFILTQEVKRGTTAVSFTLLDDGMELDLMEEAGGGIVDVVALILRIAFLILYRPKLRPIMVLDEPLGKLSTNYQPYAGKFLRQLCAELDLKILIVTHEREMADNADKVFRITKEKKVSVLSEAK